MKITITYKSGNATRKAEFENYAQMLEYISENIIHQFEVDIQPA
jgi:hypothetical protein